MVERPDVAPVGSAGGDGMVGRQDDPLTGEPLQLPGQPLEEEVRAAASLGQAEEPLGIREDHVDVAGHVYGLGPRAPVGGEERNVPRTFDLLDPLLLDLDGGASLGVRGSLAPIVVPGQEHAPHRGRGGQGAHLGGQLRQVLLLEFAASADVVDVVAQKGHQRRRAGSAVQMPPQLAAKVLEDGIAAR